MDEFYLCETEKGKRGRSSGDKISVFGLLKRGGKVYTKIISDASSKTFFPIIKRKSSFQSLSFILIVSENITCWIFLTLNTIE